MRLLTGTQRIAGYTYFPTKDYAVRHRRSGQATAFEGGLGWYNYNPREYARDPVLRIVGWPINKR